MKKRVIIFEDEAIYVGDENNSDGMYQKMLVPYRSDEVEYEFIKSIAEYNDWIKENESKLDNVVLFSFDFNIIGGNTLEIVKQIKELKSDAVMLANSGTDNHVLVELGCIPNDKPKNLKTIKEQINKALPPIENREVSRLG